MITVLLVEDDPLVRQGLRMLFIREPDMIIVGEVRSNSQALALMDTLQPDVVLVDIAMPVIDGIAAIAAQPCSAVVLLSIYDDTSMQARARAAGVAVFVGKHEGVKVLLMAIRQAACQVRKRLGEVR